MIFGMEIGLLVAGLIAVVTGKFKLTKRRLVVGAPARIAGLVLMLPLPLALAMAFVIALTEAGPGRRFDAAQWQGTLTLVELGLIAVCVLLGFGIVLAAPSSVPRDAPRLDEPDRPTDKGSVPWADPYVEPQEGISRSLPGLPPSSGSRDRDLVRPVVSPERATQSSAGAVWWVAQGNPSP